MRSKTDKFVIAIGVTTCVPVSLAIELHAGAPLRAAVAGAIMIGLATAEIIRRAVGGEPPQALLA